MRHTHTHNINKYEHIVKHCNFSHTDTAFALHLFIIVCKRNWFLWLDHAGKNITFVIRLCMFIFILCEFYYSFEYESHKLWFAWENLQVVYKKAPDNDFSSAKRHFFVVYRVTLCVYAIFLPIRNAKTMHWIELKRREKNVLYMK